MMIALTNTVAAGAGRAVDLLAATAAAPSGARRAMIFLALLVALLGAFVFLVALLTALRRRARREADKRDHADSKQTDAWAEAGRRLNS